MLKAAPEASDFCTDDAPRRGHVIEHLGAGRVRVEVAAANACARCASGRGCGLLATSTSSRLHIDCVGEASTLSVGSQVDLHIDPGGSGWLVVVAAAYGLPVLGLVAGVTLGSHLSAPAWAVPGASSDLVTAIGGLAGLGGGLLAWRLFARRLNSRPDAGPSVSAVRTQQDARHEAKSAS